MIINFSGDSIIDKLDINSIQLDDTKFWELSLLKFSAIFSSKISQSGIYEIVTNMIERDDGNSLGVVDYVY